MPKMPERIQHRAAELVHLLGKPRPRFIRHRRGTEFGDLLHQFAVHGNHLNLCRPFLAPEVPEHLRTHMIEPLYALQIPRTRTARTRQIALQPIPFATLRKGGSHPRPLGLDGGSGG